MILTVVLQKYFKRSLAKVTQYVVHRQLTFPTHMTFVNSGLEESHCNDWVQPWHSQEVGVTNN